MGCAWERRSIGDTAWHGRLAESRRLGARPSQVKRRGTRDRSGIEDRDRLFSRTCDQNGFTITRITITAVAMPGTSFISRSALSLAGRKPRANFLP
jgi:hypothetical protein